jgi:hypothetical protein
MDLIKEKKFPDNYSDSVLDILKKASFNNNLNIKILGSASIRSQQYAGDFDADCTAFLSNDSDPTQKFKDIIKRVQESCYITDFKIGHVKEWDVMNGSVIKNKVDFSLPKSLSVLDKLKADKIISPAEYKGAERLLRAIKNPLTFIKARKGIRFHILRWLPSEVLAGVKEIRGRSITLNDAIFSGGLIKLDFITSIDDRFTEFSMIYNLYLNKILVTESPKNVVDSLKEDIIYYNTTNPFKALKRLFSLAKITKNLEEIEYLSPILNSDLGRLYAIINDLATIHMLLDMNVESVVAHVKENLDELRARMGSIYSLKSFLEAEHEIIGLIESMKKMSPKRLKPAVFNLHTELQQILNETTLKKVKL